MKFNSRGLPIVKPPVVPQTQRWGTLYTNQPAPAELAARAVKELSDENRRLRLVIAALTTTPPLFERKP